MRHKHKLISTLISTLILSSCAAERATEPVTDFDDNRYEKQALLGTKTWKYKATVIKTSQIGGVSMIGSATPMHFGRFEFARNKLNFYNSISPYADGGEGELGDLINSWEIEHSEYRLREVNGKVTNVEEENSKIPWNEKNWFKIKWTSQAIDQLLPDGGCWSQVQDELVEGSQIVTPEHFSFVVETTFELNSSGCNSYANMSRRYNSSNFTTKVQVKHSFAPYEKNEDYKPFVYANEFDPRKKKFGFFETVVDRKNDQTGRFERTVLANRWDPNKSHKIFYAEDFPDEYKWIYNLCWKESLRNGEEYEECKKRDNVSIQAKTNEIFEKHGLKARFEFIDDPSVKYGDVRYSFVKFVDQDVEGSPLGYGPSDSDPMTGEILRSDSVVWTASLKFYVDLIRTYESQSLSGIDSIFFGKLKAVFKEAGLSDKEIEDFTREDFTNTAEALMDRPDLMNDSQKSEFEELSEQQRVVREINRKEFSNLLAKNLYANPYWAGYTVGSDPFSSTSEDYNLEPLTSRTSIGRAYELLNDVGSTLPAASAKLLSKLDSAVSKFVDLSGSASGWANPAKNVRQKSTVYPLEEQLYSINPALVKAKNPQEIIDTVLYRVAIHEFGHNLNLRHNFYGSVDYANFSAPKAQVDRNGEELRGDDGQVLMIESVSSSVMDYLSLRDEVNTEHSWEPYDEAALVYAYSDGQIDLNELELSEDGTHKNRQEPANFLFCTDEHAGWANPFCNRFDRGSSASEIVFSFIESYDQAYPIRNRPFGRPYWDASGYDNSIENALLDPFKFLALYENMDSWFTFLGKRSEYQDQGLTDEYEQMEQAVRDDFTRAATLLASFYSGIIKFADDADRPDVDVIDPFTGNLRIKGITYDKVVAMYGLAGTFAYSIDNAGYAYETNFLRNIDNQDSLGAVLRKELLNVAVEKVQFVGYDFVGLGRSLFLSTATTDPGLLNSQIIDRMMIECYTKAGLKQAFGIDADRFYPHVSGKNDPVTDEVELERYLTGLEAAYVLIGGTQEAQIGRAHYPALLSSTFDPTEEAEAVVVRVGSDYYVSKKLSEDSGYAYEFMRAGIGANEYEDPYNSISYTMKSYILQTKLMYDYAKYGSAQNCVDYQYSAATGN